MKEFGKGEKWTLSPRRPESGLSMGLRRPCGGRSCSVRLARERAPLQARAWVTGAKCRPQGSSSPSFTVIGSDKGTGPSAQSRPSPGRGHHSSDDAPMEPGPTLAVTRVPR